MDINKHKRTNDILLGPLERPVLNWFALHMPAWVSPDGCTVIGVIGTIMIATGYVLSRYNRNFLWLASLGFLVNWFGDSMDGTLARHRRIERPTFGFFLDHIVDAASQVPIFLGLGMTPYVSFNIASLTLIFYLLLSILAYIRTCVAGEFKISYGKLGPTEIRVLAILLNTGMYFGGVKFLSMSLGTLGRFNFTIYDPIVFCIALLLLYFFVETAVKEVIRMAKTGK